jgi:hypothetical protein
VALNQEQSDRFAEAIHSALAKSDYFPFLFRAASEIGIKLDNKAMLVKFDPANEKMTIDCDVDDRECSPELWVHLSDDDILGRMYGNDHIGRIRITTSERGQVVHPTVDRLLYSCLAATSPYPLTDREELVYGALFGFEEPQVLWASETSSARALRIRRPSTGQITLVSSGFSDPDRESAPGRDRANASGFGYELVMMIASPDESLEREFCVWVEYVETTGKHLLLGQYLEYEERFIPGTQLGGFIVVPPESIPPLFPVADGEAAWHLLLGVTPQELKEAKEHDVSRLADLLSENGIEDLTSANRPSVLS